MKKNVLREYLKNRKAEKPLEKVIKVTEEEPKPKKRLKKGEK